MRRAIHYCTKPLRGREPAAEVFGSHAMLAGTFQLLALPLSRFIYIDENSLK
jgi:hypothetical protein